MNHIQNFGQSIEDRLATMARDKEPAIERLNELVAFYHGLVAVRDHSASLGAVAGLKKAAMELEAIADRIMSRVLAEIEERQCKVYQCSAVQASLPF